MASPRRLHWQEVFDEEARLGKEGRLKLVKLATITICISEFLCFCICTREERQFRAGRLRSPAGKLALQVASLLQFHREFPFTGDEEVNLQALTCFWLQAGETVLCRARPGSQHLFRGIVATEIKTLFRC